MTLVAVCGGEQCAGATEPALQRLRPLVRRVPGAILVRTPCLAAGCGRADAPEGAHGAVVRVQRCRRDTDGLRPVGRPVEIKATDPEGCARTVSAWLRAGQVLRWPA